MSLWGNLDAANNAPIFGPTASVFAVTVLIPPAPLVRATQPACVG